MIHLVFSIHDTKAGAFLPPFILPRSEMALRTFSDCVNSEDHQFAKHPEDYTLFRLGTFDDEAGNYTLEPAPISEGNGVIFRQISEDTHGTLERQETTLGNEASIQPSPKGGNSS